MKLILYEPTEEGWVTVDPYDWEYTGRFIEVERYLESEPELDSWESFGDAEGSVERTGEEYLVELSRQLKMRGIYSTNIVQ